MQLNEALFRWINGWPNGLAPVFYVFNEGFDWWTVRILVAGFLVFVGSRKGLATVGLLIVGVLLANESTDFAKQLGQELRPCVELSDISLRVDLLTSYGTASAHSANTAVFATVLIAMHGRGFWPWAALAVMTGLARIYGGAHYPSQVLFGWVLGILVGVALVYSYRWTARTKNNEQRTEDG